MPSRQSDIEPDDQLRIFDAHGFTGDDGSVAFALAAARSMLGLAIARSAFGEKRKIGDALRERLVKLQADLCELHLAWPIVPNIQATSQRARRGE